MPKKGYLNPNSRKARILAYFKEKWASGITNPRDAYPDLMKKFHPPRMMSLYALAGDLKRLIKEAHEAELYGKAELPKTFVRRKSAIVPAVFRNEVGLQAAPQEPEAENESSLVTIPTEGLTEGQREAFSKLVTDRINLTLSLQAKDHELAAKNSQLIVLSKRLTIAKELASRALEAM